MLIYEADRRIGIKQVLEHLKKNFGLFKNDDLKECENCQKLKITHEVLEKEIECQANEIHNKDNEIHNKNNEIHNKDNEISNLREEVKYLKQKNSELSNETEKQITKLNQKLKGLKFENSESTTKNEKMKSPSKIVATLKFEITSELRK